MQQRIQTVATKEKATPVSLELDHQAIHLAPSVQARVQLQFGQQPIIFHLLEQFTLQ